MDKRRRSYLDALLLSFGSRRVSLGGAELPVLLVFPLAVGLELVGPDAELVQLSGQLSRVSAAARLQLQHPAPETAVLLLTGRLVRRGANLTYTGWRGTRRDGRNGGGGGKKTCRNNTQGAEMGVPCSSAAAVSTPPR